jgi:hypothetical protein
MSFYVLKLGFVWSSSDVGAPASPAGILHPASESKVGTQNTLYFINVKQNSGNMQYFFLE